MQFLSADELYDFLEQGKPITHGENFIQNLRHEAKETIRMSRGALDTRWLKSLASSYIENKKRSRIMIYDKPKNTVNFIKSGSLLERNYQKKLLKKINNIKKTLTLQNRQGIGITLTLQSMDIRSIYDDITLIKKSWNALRTAIYNEAKRQKKYGHDQNDPIRFLSKFDNHLDYFYMLELGSNSNECHLHVYLVDIGYVNHEWLSSQWNKITNSPIVWVSKNTTHNAFEYFSKYIKKTLYAFKEGNVDDIPMNIIAVWSSQKRLWASSLRLIRDWLKVYMALIKASEIKNRYIIMVVNSNYDGLYKIKKNNG
jgi:hypothetical protein